MDTKDYLIHPDEYKLFNIYSNDRKEYVPDEEIISEFECDWCLCLAMCIHKKYGYPLAYIELSPSYGWGMLSTDIFHVVVKISENKYLDITGFQTEEQLIKKYENLLNTNIHITHEFVDKLDYEYKGEFNIDEVVDKLIKLYLFLRNI